MKQTVRAKKHTAAKRALAALLALFLLFCVTACGEGGGGGGEHVLTIYRERSSGQADGTQDSAVKEAIEQAFYDDTGISIDLRVTIYSQSELEQRVSTGMGVYTQDLDAVISYIGEDSGSIVMPYAKSERDIVIDLTPLIGDYENILSAIRKNDPQHEVEMAAYIPVGTLDDADYQMRMIPSVTADRGYAMILNADMMRAAGLDPDEYDVLNPDGYKNMNFSDFEEMMYTVKSLPQYASMRYPIAAKPWDIVRLFGGVFDGDYGVNVIQEDGSVVPGYFTEGGQRMLDYMWKWARDGIWENESLQVDDTDRIGWFANESSAVYMSYPDVEYLISSMRTVSSINSQLDYVMIAPLADDVTEEGIAYAAEHGGQGIVRGNMKDNKASEALIIPDHRDTDTEVLLSFIDWQLSSKENYELCKYGVKGTHWDEGDPIVWGEDTYETWVYPLSDREEFTQHPPYSGKYLLVENINISNRLRGDYTADESAWYLTARNDFEAYDSDSAEGFWLPEIKDNEIRNQEGILEQNFVQYVRGPAWNGQGSTSPSQKMQEEYIPYFQEWCSDYLAYLNAQVNSSIAYFEELWGIEIG